MIALWHDLATTWRAVMAVTVGVVGAIRLLPLSRWFGRPGTIAEYAGAAIGVVVIPVFALLGIDAVLAKLGVGPFLSPLARLGIGAVIVFAVARISLEPFWTDHELPRPRLLAASATVALILVPGLVIALIGQINGDGRTLAQRPTVSHLDVVVLRADAPPAGGHTTRLGGWQIDTWTGQVKGDRIVWAGGRAPAPGRGGRRRPCPHPPAPRRRQRRAGALDGPGRPRRAARDAHVRPPRRSGRPQLEDWRTPLSGPTGRAGDALRLADLPADRTTSEAKLGLLAATQSPTASADLALAVAHRPILRFDTHEPVPRPLDVEALFRTGLISMCEGGQKLRQRCVRLDGEDGLQSGFNHLAFDSHALAHAGVPSRVYVHVTHTLPDAEGGDGLIYLDYWWYLPDNPARSGSGAFCGPGFSIGGVTCFDHQSDWEGVTVVLGARDPAGRRRGQLRPARRQRPLHVARAPASLGAHRSTALRARRRPRRPAAGVLGPRHARVLPDRVRQGVLPAERGPDAAEHGARCRTARTTVAARGRAPPTRAARGSASPSSPPAATAPSPTAGTTGRERGAPPTASRASSAPRPSRRGPPASTIAIGSHRARAPRSSSATAGSRPSGTRPAPRRSSRSAGPPAARLLALGDSYSSGEGAGEYEPGTDNGNNSCHRSRNAWPTLLAHQRGLGVLPSIACSGATLTDLMSGRAGSGQPERRAGQLARIAGDATVVTVTIGGNDLGFRSVIQDCIARDCVAKYHRPSGDVLDARIDDLARRLPAAYRAIQAAAPRARVFVVDYPRLFPDGEPPTAPRLTASPPRKATTSTARSSAPTSRSWMPPARPAPPASTSRPRSTAAS